MDEKVLQDLRTRRKGELERAKDIIDNAKKEDRGMSAEEKIQFDGHMAEAKRIEGVLSDAARAQTAERELEEAAHYDVPDAVRTAGGDGQEQKEAAIRVIENPHTAYRKGDAFGALIAGRLQYGAHEQQKAINWSRQVYGENSPQCRALQQSSFTAGGAFIPENFVGAEFIELLRAESAVRRAGARVVTLVNGSFTTPRLTAGATGDWLPTEGDNLTTSEPTAGQLKLVEKKYGVIVPFSNDLRRNASLDVIRVVSEDLLRAVANDEDVAFLNGSGLVGRPKGIYNWIPAGQKTNSAGTALANVRTDIRRMKNGLDSANVPYVRRAFFMHSRSMNYMGWDLVDGNSNFAFPSLQSSGGASLGGDPVLRDNNISITGGGGANESQIFYVEMSECYIGDSMDMEVQIFDNAAYSQSGTIRSGISRDESVLRLIRKTDFGMRHTESAFIIEAVTYGA